MCANGEILGRTRGMTECNRALCEARSALYIRADSNTIEP
jgi:hypothetical protein